MSSVLQKLGGYVDDKNDHSTFVIVGNPETGQWLKMFAMSRPDQIANAVLKMIPVNGTARKARHRVPPNKPTLKRNERSARARLGRSRHFFKSF